MSDTTRLHGANRPVREGGTLRILSIQSWVAFGHVGNAAAIFPLQRLGAEVMAMHTVQFSNHTGYGDWTGQVFTGADLRALGQGLAARGALGTLDAVLSGYLGDAGIGRAILEIVTSARAAGRPLLYCCDPVMGDAGRGLFVRPDIPRLLAQEVVPACDILTPNQFELAQLTGMACASRVALLRAVRHLQQRMRPLGPRIVLVTSVRHQQTPGDAVELLAASPAAAFLLRMPRHPIAANGAGDLIAALFLFHVLAGSRPGRPQSGQPQSGQTEPGPDLRDALESAGSATWAVLERTVADDARELSLVAAQDQIVRPTRRFQALRLDRDGHIVG
ncbi:pyridoxal kinase PdxY [Lichenicoccus sp.]|uniref:pyridoxal kinase PdxY n=1 Tax=Lichenicoccus sp. TaxID=2781899 RepID=UPI003D10BBD7